MANWERKSSYLLREIVKFSTYTDCLQAAKTAKEQLYAEREKQGREKESEVREGAATAEGVMEMQDTEVVA